MAILTMLMAVAFLPAAPRGGAEPTDNPPPTDTLNVSWQELGVQSPVSFYGSTSTTNLSFPVPSGLIPVAVNATVNLPFSMRSGVLTVTQDDRLISRIGLPLGDLTPVVIPLPGVQVVDKSVTVALTVSGVADDGYCLDQYAAIDLVNGSVAFSGADEPPATVADFLPALLRKLTIAVPANPSQAESDAAVVLATSVVARYRGQPLQVIVVQLPDGATALDGPSAPFERRIAVKEGTDEGLSLQGSGGIAQLLISGTGGKLANQARLLTDSSLGLAVSPKVVAGKIHSGPVFPGNAVTLAQIGQNTTSAVGLPPQVEITLDQTRFGRSTQGFRLHLRGSYTPMPTGLGGRVTVTVNGVAVDSWAAEPNGGIDRWVTIPDRLVQRYTAVEVGLNATGNTGRCNEFRPMTLTITGDSLVENAPARPPIPVGFGSLPQALMPTTQVGIGDNSFPDTVRAVQIMTGMQRLSVMPLTTEVTSVKQAMATRGPAVVISPEGWTDPSVVLPVRADGSTITLEGAAAGDDPATLTLDPAVPFGSLQTVFDGTRSLLIATSNGAPGQLDELLGWLGNDAKRWTQLRGSAIVAFPGREPASVAGRTPPGVYGPEHTAIKEKQAEGGYRGSPAWWVAAAVVAAAGLGVAAIVVSARRSTADRIGRRRR